MRITKIDAQYTQQQKFKTRTLSNSTQKTKSLLIKKKIQPILINNTHDPLLITKPLRLLPNQINTVNINIDQQNYTDKQYMNNKDLKQNGLSAINQSRKQADSYLLNQKQQKQVFLQFIQTQLKYQYKQDSKSSSKQKIKLPLINKNNQNQEQQPQRSIQQNYQQNNINKYISPQNSTHNSIHQKNSNKTLQSISKQTPEIRKNNKQTAGAFINIKSVIPKQKISTYKKKDHSLRDLRILRRQRQEPLIDHVMQQLNFSENQQIQTDGRTNLRLKSNTALIKRSKGSQYSSPLKLTADKKRSHLDSGQKTQKYPYNNNIRDKKSFSINQNNKKKFAVNYMDFCLFLSAFNKIKVTNSSIVLYKAFVGKGNNSILVKNAIKNRFWWNIVSEKNEGEINFLWQQSKCPAFLASLNTTTIDTQQNNKQSLSQKQIQVKKQKLHLQNKNQQKTNENIKQFVQNGFLRLLSSQQAKQVSATPYYVQLPSSQQLSSNYTVDSNKTKIHNHLQFNAHLTNKKALFYNLKTYYELINDDPFKYIPLTFHVKQYGDGAWNQFKQIFQEKSKEHSLLKADFSKKKKKDKPSSPLWIIKPGQNTNRGCGIQVSDSLQQIAEMVRTKTATGKNKSSIIQRYLMPFLYQKRKFDIRCYMVATSIKGTLKGYWYQQGYIRTSCKQFTTKNLKNRMIHLTNDAVQKKSQDYGKYQNGNKLSFTDFQRYLDNNYPERKLNFFKQCYPQMMKLAKDALNATYQVLDSNNKEFTFEVFGLDFMIDEDFNTWLIEVNNNPCLELSSPLLARIIPNMIENAFKIALDPIFPPPILIPKTKTLPTDLFQSNKYSLIFNSADVQEKVQHFMSENKINLSKIIEGEEQEDQELADEDEEFCQNISNSNPTKSIQISKIKNEKEGEK